MNILETLEKFIKSKKRPLIVILGATASGKTNISLKIAKHINGEIISTDSRQIYREMDIATDVILKEDQKGIPHHMLNIADPDEVISLAEYRDMALEKIEDIFKRKKIPMLVGGTGLYISAIIEDYAISRVPPNKKLREELEKEAEKNGKEFVYKKLQKLDPEEAGKIHPNNLRYVIRAIEKKTGKEKPQNPDIIKVSGKELDTFLLGVKLPREKVYEKINKRVDEQITRGLVEEVTKLVEKKYDENLPSMTALGVKEIIPYIKGEMDLEKCKEILKRNTRHYAKRQTSWLKRYNNVLWINPETEEEIVNEEEN